MDNKGKNNKYPPESAGRRMISNVPTVLPEERILDLRKRLFEKAREFATLNYIYVVDQGGKLVGVLSLKDIFQKPEETRAEDLMVRKIVKAHPYTDQEKVAILSLKYNLKSIPIVDKENFFLGIVTSDVILEILHSEHVEDILRFAGVFKGGAFPSRILQAPAGLLAKLRLPWLIFGLFGGILMARIATFFETPLRDHFILAAFIPLILYMAHAVGVQSQTLFIRNLALTEFSQKNYFFKEIKVGVLMAFSLAVLLFFVSLLFSGQPYISFILSFSLFWAITAAIVNAVLVPWILQKLKKDPALGSGPFSAIVTDVTSLLVYFFSISLLL